MFGALKLTFLSFNSMMWDTLNAYDCLMKRRKTLQPMQMFCQSHQHAEQRELEFEMLGILNWMVLPSSIQTLAIFHERCFARMGIHFPYRSIQYIMFGNGNWFGPALNYY